MIRFKNNIIELLTICFVLPAITIINCDSPADLDLSTYNSQLVTNCLFQPDSVWTVNISSSIGAFDNNEPQIINDAEVEIWNNNALIAILPNVGEGIFKTSFLSPEGGNLYRIKVSSPGYKSIFASDKIPLPVLIQTAENEIRLGAQQNNITATIDIEFTFTDPANTQNFYSVSLFIKSNLNNNQQVFFKTSEKTIIEAIKENYAIIPEIDDLYWDVSFSDKSFNSQTKSIKLSAEFDVTDDTIEEIHLVLSNVSSTYYDYKRTMELKLYRDDDPFAEPVNIFGNIENGLGIFAGFNSSSITILPNIKK